LKQQVSRSGAGKGRAGKREANAEEALLEQTKGEAVEREETELKMKSAGWETQLACNSAVQKV